MIKKGFSQLPLFFIVVGVLLVGLLIWFFMIGTAPKSYSECLKTHTNDYTRNELMCSFSPKTYADQRICKQKNGTINQFGQCLIVYYNPDFILPKTLIECGSKVGYIDMNKTTCDVQIGPTGAYDESVANDLLERCLQSGGQKNINNGCWIRFTPKGIEF